jgi:hypothetical protein
LGEIKWRLIEMDRETREFLDRKFGIIDEKFEDTRRHFGVIAEGLRSEIQQAAEGVVNLNEKFDREMASFREENELAHRRDIICYKIFLCRVGSAHHHGRERSHDFEEPGGAVGEGEIDGLYT